MRKAMTISFFVVGAMVFLAGPVGAQSNDAPCALELHAEVMPQRVLVGETAAVTMTARASCPGIPARQNMVLLLDGSGSMGGDRNRELKQGARRFVSGLGLDGSAAAPLSIGVVTFDTTARALCLLTTSAGRVNACIGRVGAAGGTDLAAGLALARSVLERGRDPDGPLPESILMIGDPEMNEETCPAAVSAVGETLRQGIHVGIVCMADECNHACLREALPEPNVFHHAPDPADMSAAISEAGASLVGLAGEGRAAERVVRLHAANDATIVPGSLAPEPDSRAGGLTWREGQARPPGIVSTAPFTITFRVRPTQPGRHEAFDRGVVAALDYRGQMIQRELDGPVLLALEPHARPTDAARATATSPTPPDGARRLHLPALLRDAGP